MIDIGANLTNKIFADDMASVLARAKDNGVSAIVVTGTDLESSNDAQRLAKQHPEYLYATAGVHPHHADDFKPENTEQLEALLQTPEVVAVGETGLDFNRNFSSQDNQRSTFRSQLELAVNTGKPVFMHEREAAKDFIDIYSHYSDKISHGVVHCFTGDENTLQHYLSMGLYIGITGWICDPKRGAALRKIVNQIPLDRLMIETDAPYLSPFKGAKKSMLAIKHRNEPWTLPYVAAELARAMEQSEEELKNATTMNSRRFFGLT